MVFRAPLAANPKGLKTVIPIRERNGSNDVDEHICIQDSIDYTVEDSSDEQSVFVECGYLQERGNDILERTVQTENIGRKDGDRIETE